LSRSNENKTRDEASFNRLMDAFREVCGTPTYIPYCEQCSSEILFESLGDLRWLSTCRCGKYNDSSLRELKAVGYWKEKADEATGWIFPSCIIDTNWEPDYKPQIISYLRRGVIYHQYLGVSHCRFQCGIDNDEMGSVSLSDGVWEWPEGLAHYIEAHDVFLPHEFVDFMKSTAFAIPSNLTTQMIEYLPSNCDSWNRWCQTKSRIKF